MAYDAQLTERVQEDHGDTAAPASAPPRERRRWTPWLGPAAIGLLGIVAVCVVVSAVTVVSRLPFGDTGVVLPTVPVTTSTASPPPPTTAAPIPPPATQAPSSAPTGNSPAIVPTPATPSAPPPPPIAPHPSSPRSQPSSAPPSTQRPSPQAPTEFLGAP